MLRRGYLVKARDHLRAAEADSGTHTQRYGLWVVLARACLADAEGQRGVAAAALTGAFGDGEPTRLLTVGPSHWPGTVRIALRGADSSAAQAVSDALRALIARDDSRQIVGAVRAHVDGLLHRDPCALASAITAYQSGDRPPALAAACEDLGELLATSADTTAEIPHVEEAGELASASGALRDHERIRRRLRRLGVRTGAPRHHTTGPPGWGP
ncbi:hypothetical protein [Streptomyces antimycoticus]|uniref:hypothetical protein n=1 Tax=Streptomyces antimycoticus TaxID=68175 RepID=UPI00367AFF9B